MLKILQRTSPLRKNPKNYRQFYSLLKPVQKDKSFSNKGFFFFFQKQSLSTKIDESSRFESNLPYFLSTIIFLGGSLLNDLCFSEEEEEEEIQKGQEIANKTKKKQDSERLDKNYLCFSFPCWFFRDLV